MRKILKYEFVLHIPELNGEVNGLYMETSTDISRLKRRLKRMLKCKKLNIIYINSDYSSWVKGFQSD